MYMILLTAKRVSVLSLLSCDFFQKDVQNFKEWVVSRASCTYKEYNHE